MHTDSQSATPAKQIRHATWQRHQRIEKCGTLKRVFSADYLLEEYSALLKRFYGFYSAVEPLLENTLADDSDGVFLRPKKSLLLAQDLVELGIIKPAKLPACTELPSVRSAAAAIGVAYVLEGATMGGMYISEHLAGHFGAAAEPALSFFRSYGEATVPQWTAFKAALNQRFADDESGLHELIQATDATYARLNDWLELAGR
jgi:heme oxygenase